MAQVCGSGNGNGYWIKLNGPQDEEAAETLQYYGGILPEQEALVLCKHINRMSGRIRQRTTRRPTPTIE